MANVSEFPEDDLWHRYHELGTLRDDLNVVAGKIDSLFCNGPMTIWIDRAHILAAAPSQVTNVVAERFAAPFGPDQHVAEIEGEARSIALGWETDALIVRSADRPGGILRRSTP